MQFAVFAKPVPTKWPRELYC